MQRLLLMIHAEVHLAKLFSVRYNWCNNTYGPDDTALCTMANSITETVMSTNPTTRLSPILASGSRMMTKTPAKNVREKPRCRSLKLVLAPTRFPLPTMRTLTQRKTTLKFRLSELVARMFLPLPHLTLRPAMPGSGALRWI